VRKPAACGLTILRSADAPPFRTPVRIIIIIIIIREIGRRITLVTEDSRETVFLFQRLSIALQRGNTVSFLSTFTATD